VAPGAAPDRPRACARRKTRAWQKLLIERGYTARTIPREYGGYGGDADI
jgi:alkylation response protein AidB-like acyl-CoA dehydrogenase